MKHTIRGGFLVAALLLGGVAQGHGYWIHRSRSLQGQHRIVVQDSVRYLYVRVDARHPARWTLKRPRSVKFRLVNRSRKGPARVRLLRNGKPYKTWRVKKRREVKVHLPRGTYRLESRRPVLVRYYEWRQPRLRRVVPLEGGWPLTLQVKDKHTTYYRVSPDHPVDFRIRGPARVWFYFRGILGETPEFQVLEGDSLVFRLRNAWQPSQRARVLEDSTLRVTRPRKRFLRVPPGEHRYRVRVRGGQGLVKLYRELPARRARKTRRPSPRERILRSPQGILGWPLWLFARSPRPRFWWTATVDRLAVLSNPFALPEEDLRRIRAGEAGYRYPGVHRAWDLQVRLRLQARWRPRSRARPRFTGTLWLYGHLWNPVKNRLGVKVEGSRRLGRRGRAGIVLSWWPRIFVRPVYRASAARTDPLVYAVGGLGAWLRPTAGGLLSVDWRRYVYQAPFAYASGDRWLLGIEAERKPLRLVLRAGVYRTRRHPWEPDASYHLLRLGLRLRWRVQVSGEVTRKVYTTADPSDDLHYGRRDLERRVRLRVPLRLFRSPIPGTLVLAYTGRRVEGAGGALLFKNYDAWLVGLAFGGR